MRLHLNKPGIRVLGFAESFAEGDRWSTLGGVVMRSDFVIDGFVLNRLTVGGDDATKRILSSFRRLARNDINALMLSGCVLSMYNIVDIESVAKRSGLPVLCLTYRETKGIEDAIRYHFPRNGSKKLEAYRRLGDRLRVWLSSGKSVYLRVSGMNESEAARLTDKFTIQGSIPEPVRVAKLFARAVRISESSLQG